MELTARDIAQLTRGDLDGDADVAVTGVAGIREAEPGEVSFVAHPKYLAAFAGTRASIVILPRSMRDTVPGASADTRPVCVFVDDPILSFTLVVRRLVPPPISYAPGIHPKAVIAPDAQLGAEVCVQAFAVIEPGARIGNRTVIGVGCYIGHGAVMGDDCILYPNVTVREHTRIGCRVILHSGVVLGADGFGFEQTTEGHRKIPQVGFVEVCDDVEMGANTTVDRGRFGRTRIGRGTKIDNQVQIAHNCMIGEHNIICAQTGIAGSVITGERVIMAGQVGIVGHISIGAKAIIMAKAGITKEVPPGAIMLGAPAVPQKQFKKSHAALQSLPEWADDLRSVKKQLAELEARLRVTEIDLDGGRRLG